MPPTPSDKEALLDRVLDLQHDLGKYLRLPLRMLPKEAGTAEVRAAVREALFETRRAGGSVRGARVLWEEFRDSSAALLADSDAYLRLRDAVERALAWETAVDAPPAVPRERADQDFAAVQAAIAALRDELERDG